jgi:ABC-type arginine/histidine transport system permease subunit
MTALALNLRLDRTALMRGALAGIAWGLVMTAALLGMAYADCGLTCDLDVATTTALSVATGLVAIGPLALLGRRPGR